MDLPFYAPLPNGRFASKLRESIGIEKEKRLRCKTEKCKKRTNIQQKILKRSIDYDSANKDLYDCAWSKCRTTMNRGKKMIEQSRKEANKNCSNKTLKAMGKCYNRYREQLIEDTKNDRKLLNECLSKDCSRELKRRKRTVKALKIN
jgi:hypothetical protein